MPLSTPSTYTTLFHLLHFLHLFKDLNLDSNPDVKPGLNPVVKPAVNSVITPVVNPNLNPTLKPDTKPDLNPVVKPDLDPDVKPDVKPELPPISSLEAGCQRQIQYSLETISSLLPFPITTLSYNLHCISGIEFTYHPNLYYFHITWIEFILPIIQLLVSFFHLK